MTAQTIDAVEHALDRAVECLRAAERVLVVAHEKPDGDAIGCTLATAEIAAALGCDVVRFNVDPVPDNLTFLPGSDAVVSALPDGWRPDVTVLLDCAQRHRAGDAFPADGWGETVICLDHHKTHDPDVADIFAHDVGAAAAGELVYRLAGRAGVALTMDIALPLYTALLTDTGSFRYDSTRPETFEMAAALLRVGVQPWFVASAIYESEPLARLRLVQEVLATLEVSCNGTLATMAIDSAMLARTGADASMTGGLVNYARSVRGVEVAALLTEQPDGGFRVGLRSRGTVDVALVAEAFGGGGHKNAAGFASDGPLTALRARLDEALETVLSST